MNAKYFISLFIGLLFGGNVFSQDIVSELKKFYREADMDYYTAKIEKNVWDCYKAQCEKWKVDESVNPPRTEQLKGKTVRMLAVQFVDMDTFQLSDNIYGHITIDSTRVFTLACVDEEMNVLAFANYYDGEYAWADIKSLRPTDTLQLRTVIKNIQARQPELILFCHSLRKPNDLNAFMYVKEGEIYVYRVREGDAFELNNYVRQFLGMEEIRRLNYIAVPFVYQFYEKEASIRRTENTPKSLKILYRKE
jgi:hypothetical protein